MKRRTHRSSRCSGVGVVAFRGAADVRNLGGVVAERVVLSVGLNLDVALGQRIVFGSER
jgi:hypothetical protein